MKVCFYNEAAANVTTYPFSQSMWGFNQNVKTGSNFSSKIPWDSRLTSNAKFLKIENKNNNLKRYNTN